MNMLNDTLLNRQTATQFAEKETKHRFALLLSLLIALRYLFLFIKKTSNASEAMRSDITCFGVGVADTYIN